MLYVWDIYFVIINLVLITKSNYNNIDRSCSCFIDLVSAKIVDPVKLKRIVYVHESAYASNELVVCVELIEARWLLDQVNIDLIQIMNIIYWNRRTSFSKLLFI